MSGWGVPNLENTFTQLSRAAKDIGTHLGSGLNSVAENLEGAFIQIGEGTAERAGCVRRGSSTEEEQVEDLEEGGGGGEGGGGEEAEGSERERVLLNQEVGGGMGCGSSYSAYIPQPSSTQVDNMLCDMCQARLNFIKRKKVCSECCNCFCSTCLPSENGKSTRTCARCKVLERKPGERTELMKLRVKDLQLYLSRRQINIKACVEKKDLVELVLETNGDGGERRSIRPTPLSNPSWQDPSIRVSDQVPLERASNFPKSYTESSHRREWFEKFDGQTADIPVDSETFVTGTESSAVGTLSADTLDESVIEALPIEDSTILVERLNSPGEEVGEGVLQERDQGLSEQPPIEEDEYIEVVEVSESSESLLRSSSNTDLSSQGAVGGEPPVVGDQVQDQVEQDAQPSSVLPRSSDISSNQSSPQDIGSLQDEEIISGSLETPASRLRPTLIPDQLSKSVPTSPRRFANQGVVYLSEIQSAEDLRELSAKQAKGILAMNRVNFKGCVEKEELLKIVERLWRQEVRNKEHLEDMEDDSICKICMDAPIDCVMLECGHMCTCTNCGKQMAECPICRQYVVRVVRTFKA